MRPGLVTKRPSELAGTVLESEAEAVPLKAFPLAVEFILAKISETGKALHKI